jgi:hypothetical protein
MMKTYVYYIMKSMYPNWTTLDCETKQTTYMKMNIHMYTLVVVQFMLTEPSTVFTFRGICFAS